MPYKYFSSLSCSTLQTKMFPTENLYLLPYEATVLHC